MTYNSLFTFTSSDEFSRYKLKADAQHHIYNTQTNRCKDRIIILYIELCAEAEVGRAVPRFWREMGARHR